MEMGWSQSLAERLNPVRLLCHQIFVPAEDRRVVARDEHVVVGQVEPPHAVFVLRVAVVALEVQREHPREKDQILRSGSGLELGLGLGLKSSLKTPN